MKESDAPRDGYPEDMNSGSLYLASIGVRTGEGDMLRIELIYLMICGMIGG